MGTISGVEVQQELKQVERSSRKVGINFLDSIHPMLGVKKGKKKTDPPMRSLERVSITEESQLTEVVERDNYKKSKETRMTHSDSFNPMSGPSSPSFGFSECQVTTATTWGDR